MEFEKTLYRVHEKVLSGESTAKGISICFYACLILSSIYLPVFIYANLRYKDSSDCVLTSLVAYNEKKKQEFLGKGIEAILANLKDSPQKNENFSLIATEKVDANNETKVGVVQVPVTFFHTDDVFNIEISSEDKVYARFEASTMLPILVLSNELRREHNFTEHNITVPAECYGSSFLSWMLARHLIGFESIAINEIAAAFNETDIFIKDPVKNDYLGWTSGEQEYYRISGLRRILMKIVAFIKVVFGLFLVSNITALYTKVSIIGAPVLIIMLFRCMNRPELDNDGARLHLYRTFPWVGQYLYALSFSGARGFDSWVLLGFLLTVLLFYCIYLTSLFLWNSLLFYKSAPRGLDESFYGFVAILEFAALVFIRTRSSLKFFPGFAVLLLVSFLMYFNTSVYGFYSLALYNVIFLSLAGLAYVLLYFEIPALSWNESHHYTPSINKPRTLFFPAFSLNWVTDLPQLWSMFVPLVGRSGFTPAQLSYVDGNMELLNNMLLNGNQDAGQQGNQPAPPPAVQAPANQAPRGRRQGGNGLNEGILQNVDANPLEELELGLRGEERGGARPPGGAPNANDAANQQYLRLQH